MTEVNYSKILSMATTCYNNVKKNQKNGISSKWGYYIGKSILNPKKNVKKISIDDAPSPIKGVRIDKTVKKSQYIDIIENYVGFIEHHHRLPNFVTVLGVKVDPHLFTAFVSFILYKKLPASQGIKSSIYDKPSKGGAVCKKLASVSHVTINNYKDVYKAMMKFSYEYYNNDIKPRAKTFNDKAGNCVDLNQIAYYALKELGYTVQIVRGTVKCDQTYGHVWCRIKINGKWVNFDASAAARGKSLGNMICGTITSITDINPAWAVSDDGIT